IVTRLAQLEMLREEVIVRRIVAIGELVDPRHEVVVRLRAALEELLAAFLAREHLRRVHLRAVWDESPGQRSRGHLDHEVEPA
ncbi:hypothetical protein PMAYCL1PPCAC_21933, partial [Pristionchus mayeri]